MSAASCAEVEQGSILESNGVAAITVIGVNELDIVGQLAGFHGHMMVAPLFMPLIR